MKFSTFDSASRTTGSLERALRNTIETQPSSRAFPGERSHLTVRSVLNMAPNDQKTEVVTPAEVLEDLPLPSDPKVIFLGGLFVLAVLAA